MSVTLYSADGCHLCEQAKDLLAQTGVTYELIDIALDDELVARYGIRIPVISKSSGDELGWPFTAETLIKFLD